MSSTKAIYRIEAQGDTLYVKAESEEVAIKRMEQFTGPIPRKLLTITTVAALPKGEEFL